MSLFLSPCGRTVFCSGWGVCAFNMCVTSVPVVCVPVNIFTVSEFLWMNEFVRNRFGLCTHGSSTHPLVCMTSDVMLVDLFPTQHPRPVCQETFQCPPPWPLIRGDKPCSTGSARMFYLIIYNPKRGHSLPFRSCTVPYYIFLCNMYSLAMYFSA